MMVTKHLPCVITLRVCKLIVLCVTLLLLLYLYKLSNCEYEVFCGYGTCLECDNDDFTAIPKPGNGELRTLKTIKKTKTILYWTKMFNSRNFYLGEGDIFEGCPTPYCMGTDDRNYQSVDKFDFLMFHGPELNELDLPKSRLPHQHYIFMDAETQSYHPIANKTIFRNFFNWTMTYRRDTDIMLPYGIFRNISSNEVIPPQVPTQWIDVSDGVVDEKTRASFKTKSKIAAWFVSHCTTNSEREKVVKKLEEYVTVDIYGECGDLQCSRTAEFECYKDLGTNYFFYLSFENSMCRDYLTEKVYKIFDYNVIPVVYGAADYKHFLPPHSYVNVLDFPSIQVLADYLIELSQDEERYLEYFKWKSFYRVDYSRKYISCKICEALHQPNQSNQIIEDVYKWWTEGSGCVPPPSIT